MKALLVLFAFLILPAAWAQKGTLEGFVYGEQGEPIEDVMVRVLNMGRPYSMTDATGYFSLPEVEAEDSLVVSHIAYGRMKVGVDGQKRMVVKLPREENIMPSFTLIGYSTQNDPPAPVRNMFGQIETPKIKSLQMPATFPGKMLGSVQSLAQTISYPAEATRNEIEGLVEISFTVNKNGDIRSPRITKSLGFGCDEEVTKAVLNMPRWIPGIQNGKTVDVPFTLSVYFSLREKPSQSVESAELESKESPQPAEPVFMIRDKVVEGKGIGEGLQGFGIKKLEVFKGKAATDQFGEQGRDGVILITPNTRN